MTPLPGTTRAAARFGAALAALWLLASAGAHAGVWSNLWRTPDQQGQHLLSSGHPGQAAAVFEDPRRRAFADLRAGRYGEAARLLSPFEDAVSQYNRGNALAHTGRLQAALDAYDAALKQAPDDHDIAHNRELVARVLDHEKHDAEPAGNGARHHQAGGGKSSHRPKRHGAGAGRPGANEPAPAEGAGKPGKRDNAGAGNSAPGNRAAKPRAGSAPHGQAGPTPLAQAGQEQGKAPGSAGAAGARSGAKRQAPAAAKPAAAKAKEAAAMKAAAMKAAKSAAAGTARPGQTPLGETGSTAARPPTERALALDQWLRQIPDDAGGLLRRKFLIEHALRQQESGQQ